MNTFYCTIALPTQDMADDCVARVDDEFGYKARVDVGDIPTLLARVAELEDECEVRALEKLEMASEIGAWRGRYYETRKKLEAALGHIAEKDWSSLCADAAAEEMRDVARAALSRKEAAK